MIKKKVMKLAEVEVSVRAHLSLVISLHQPNASYTSTEVESQQVTCAVLSGPSVLPLSLLTRQPCPHTAQPHGMLGAGIRGGVAVSRVVPWQGGVSECREDRGLV